MKEETDFQAGVLNYVEDDVEEIGRYLKIVQEKPSRHGAILQS